MSILQGKDDIFLDMRQKFWNTYKVRQTFEKDNHDLSVSFFFFKYLFIYLAVSGLSFHRGSFSVVCKLSCLEACEILVPH